jgi:RNA polymerase sigma-70 factor (ECF subfamily)
MDAAYNLARWLTGNDHDAQDVAQEAFLRAFKFFASYRGDNARAWLLTIVRNSFYNWLQKNHRPEIVCDLEEAAEEAATETTEPISMDADLIRRAISELPVGFREAVVLREMEGFSYKEIADLAGVPIGTVMSRLARARKLLQKSLAAEFKPESK